MDDNARRAEFLTRTLYDEIIENPFPYYRAFEEGEEAVEAYVTALWAARHDLSRHPFFVNAVSYVLEEGEEGFCALTTLTLPKTASASEQAGIVVIGSDMDPRLFAALPFSLPGGETLRLAECKAQQTVEIALLTRGCDNDLTLFDPPSPQGVNPALPLPRSRRERALVELTVRWCLEHD